ncbi:hypothetical protein Bhyg_11765 [Pseudolycoriella hygida]|uniref:Uncharacterized protein n=1 Tax=Pseudolycoriella hygida TaxID=35572 RepID=A0A9Q0MVZ4_9DIPT|nr:hypothetical protein Bhyg_11765 [Pseudolycoriella hygida]
MLRMTQFTFAIQAVYAYDWWRKEIELQHFRDTKQMSANFPLLEMVSWLSQSDDSLFIFTLTVFLELSLKESSKF